MNINDDFLSLIKSNQTPSLKSDLFVKINQIRSMLDELEKVILLPKKKKENWISQNYAFLQEMMDEYLDDSELVFEGITLDNQSRELAVEYVTNLRDMITIMKSILQGKNQLRG